MNNLHLNTNERTCDIIKKCKKIVITGGVGVGKSTTIKHLKEIFECTNIHYIIIPEYINGDGDNGVEMLNRYLNHDIDSFTFQYYILTFYDRYLNNLQPTEDTVLIFERLPDDSITCFANKANKNKELTNEDLFQLFKYSQEITKRYNLPSYFTMDNNQTTNISIIKSDDTRKIASQVYDMYVSSNKHDLYLICLYNTSEECMKRIHKRGIPSEIQHYSLNEIKQFNRHYTKLYTLFMTGETLRYCDIGKLLE